MFRSIFCQVQSTRFGTDCQFYSQNRLKLIFFGNGYIFGLGCGRRYQWVIGEWPQLCRNRTFPGLRPKQDCFLSFFPLELRKGTSSFSILVFKLIKVNLKNLILANCMSIPLHSLTKVIQLEKHSTLKLINNY